MQFRLYPVEALLLLLCCVLGVLAQKTTDYVEIDEEHNLRREESIKIGTVQKGTRETSPKVIYLALTIPTNGIFFKFKLFLISKDPVFIQLWRPVNNEKNTFTFIDQIKVQTDRVNETSTFYPIEYRGDTQPQCPVVRRGDKLGILSTTPRLAVPIHFNASTQSIRVARRDSSSQLHSKDTVDFSRMVFPYVFSIEAFIYKDNSQRQVQISRHYRPCPMRLIPKYPSTTDATSTGNSFADRHSVYLINVHISKLVFQTEKKDMAKPRTRITSSMTPSTKSSPEINFTEEVNGNTDTKSSKVMYIAVGVMAGVAVVAIISVVVLAMYCRRHHQKDPLKSEPKHSVDQPKETPGCTPSAPTSNPAYGVNCDFLNNYEMPENVNSQSLEPHVYPPLVPPRPSNQEDSRHSGTYEEIKDTINKGSAVQGCEIRSDQVSLPENEYDLYGSPEYEHLKTDINNGEIVRNNDIVLDNVTSDPELQGKNQKRDPGQTATYLDLLQK
ncbi:hypothetical protein LSH36_241g04026 [Paralvinella palmiformis]|uniref:Uncharacterized protein n=1 Tax=Paralvinella palmiformis TaxID=53620 RepID=A0AAD9N349_9ANNE|nr:hypothetical protein LSH36_241g04026 [Paralvinella palmiformis]